MKMKIKNPERSRSGSTLLEFVFAGSFIFLPLLIGTVTVGMSLLRSIEVTALNRDAGRMFAAGVDFSQAANQNLLVKIAGDLNITAAGGQGVVILSEIDATGTNQAVCSRQLVIGNAALRASSFASPTDLDSAGNVTNLNDPTANAATFTPAVMPMSKGQVAYVVETYYSTASYDWTGLLKNTGVYVRAIF
jgi:hypothetical protein